MKKLLLFMLLAGLVQASDLLGARRIPRPEQIRAEDRAEEIARYEAFKDQIRLEDLNRKIQEAAKREAAKKAQKAKTESKKQKEQKEQADQKSQEPGVLTKEVMNTQFLVAAARGDEKRAQELLDSGTKFNFANENGMTALMLAAHSNRVDMIIFLLDHMTKVQEELAQLPTDDIIGDYFNYTQDFLNAQNKDGNSAIMFAAKNCNELIMKLLLETHVIVTELKNNNGQTYKDILEENKALRFWQEQLTGKYGKDAELLAEKLIIECRKLEELVNPVEIELNKLDKEIKELDTQVEAINFEVGKQFKAWSNLSEACEKLRNSINKYRDEGLQENDVIGVKTTTDGEIEQVTVSAEEKELSELEKKLEIAQKECDNIDSASHEKLHERYNSKLEAREELKKKVEKNRGSLNALEKVLIRAKHQASADFKKDEDKKKSVMSPTEANELLIAGVCSYDLNDIERALKNGANPNIAITKYTPLTWFVTSLKDVENMDLEESAKILVAINYLIKMGADVNASDNEGYTPFCLAVTQANPFLARLLLENGANPNQEIELTVGDTVPQGISYTPLMLAVNYLYEYPDFISYFIEKFDININAQSTDGSTALMNAITRYVDEDSGLPVTHISEEIVRILLANGADANITDNEGRKFVDLITNPELKKSMQKFINDFYASEKGLKRA